MDFSVHVSNFILQSTKRNNLSGNEQRNRHDDSENVYG